jgi:aconitase A
VEPSLTGPRRPQDRVTLSAVKRSFLDALGTLGAGYGMQDRDLVCQDSKRC